MLIRKLFILAGIIGAFAACGKPDGSGNDGRRDAGSDVGVAVDTGLGSGDVAATDRGDLAADEPGELVEDVHSPSDGGDGRIDTGCGRPDCEDGGEPASGVFRQIVAGRHHSCALYLDGSAYCWGQGAFRALGGDYNFQGEPRQIDAFTDIEALYAGTRFGCAIRSGGELFCWGESDETQVGANATIPCGDCTPIPECATSVCVPEPQPMAGLETGVADAALGESHACALRSDGTVECWGGNEHGQLGDGSTVGSSATPVAVAGVNGATQVSAGIDHTCALIGSPGGVMCWGRNDRAQVGNGEVSDAVPSAVAVDGVSDAVEIIGGGSHTCARRASGAIVCWGYNYLGSLGNGSTRPTRATSPQQVVGIDDAEALAAGQYFTCALRAGGVVSCWGDNRHGQLGDGTSTGADCADRPCRTTPVDVLVIEDPSLITAGELHACAANDAGVMWCWGYNLGGQLGTGGVNDGPTPDAVVVQGLP